jgi:hypothetical protein
MTLQSLGIEDTIQLEKRLNKKEQDPGNIRYKTRLNTPDLPGKSRRSRVDSWIQIQMKTLLGSRKPYPYETSNTTLGVQTCAKP